MRSVGEMTMELRKAKAEEAKMLTEISKQAFDTDINVGSKEIGGPPCYDDEKWHVEMMSLIETMNSKIHTIKLDTPIWNIRTNQFYQKLGYKEVKTDNEFVYYQKTLQ